MVKGLASIVILSVAVLSRPGGAQVQNAEFEALRQKYVGNYDTDAFLAEPRIRMELTRLLGAELPRLLENLDVRGSVDFVGGTLSLSGNAVHGGALEEAVVCVRGNLRIDAAIFSKGRFTIYARAANYDEVALCVKDWITQVKSGHRDRFEMPVNTRLVTGK
jgi:hypothetical protein